MRILNASRGTEVRYRYRRRDGQLRAWRSYETVPMGRARKPTRVCIPSSFRYREGRLIRQRQRRILTMSSDTNGKASYEKKGGAFVSVWNTVNLGLRSEQYSMIGAYIASGTATGSEGYISVFDSLGHPLLYLRVDGIVRHKNLPSPGPLLDSAIHAIPVNIASYIRLRLTDEELPTALTGIDSDTLSGDALDALDSLLDEVLAFQEISDSDGRRSIRTMDVYEYRRDGRLLRSLSWNPGSHLRDGGLRSLDSMGYDSQQRLVYWDQWKLAGNIHPAWEQFKQDALPLRHIWSFRYDDRGRVHNAVHQIWSSPPPDLDTFYHKATEYYHFEYNPDGSVIRYSKNREEFSQEGGLPISSTMQRYELRYRYFHG